MTFIVNMCLCIVFLICIYYVSEANTASETLTGRFLLVEMFWDVVSLKSDPWKDWISNL